MSRYIVGFRGLAKACADLVIKEPVFVEMTMAESAKIMKYHVKKLYGDVTRLAALSEYTQEERQTQGFSPDQPLLRDGSLLRDHVYARHTPISAEVGTPEIINAYLEFGYVNARTHTSVPARPVFKYGIEDSKAEIADVFEANLGILLDGRAIKPRFVKDVE